MTFAQKTLDSVYTATTGKLTAYSGLANLETCGKFDLIRFNGCDDKGFRLTLATVATTQYTSNVSKAASEKGTKPVVIEPGNPLVFNIVIQAKDRDGKDNPEFALAKQLVIIFNELGVKEDTIYFFRGDLGSVAPKSNEKLVRMIANSEWAFCLPTDFNFEETGQSEPQWTKAVETLSGEKFEAQKTYAPKKTKDEVFRDNIVALSKLDDAVMQEAYKAVYGADSLDELEDGDLDQFIFSMRTSILLSL